MNREVDLFERALEFTDDVARHGFLRESCGADSDLLERLERLLRIHEQADGFLARPATLDVADLKRPSRKSYHPGDRLGHYELVKVLGTGGMSDVWQARQTEPVRRDVAIKLLSHVPRVDNHGHRVRREIHALALMHHPNVATILDAGQTDQHELYFVMELVEGVPVTDFCRDRKLPLTDCLKLFLNICGGVQHAHQRGVIHRDLKPANLLAYVQDGVAHAKVIDFGIAKLIDSEAMENRSTLAGQLIGTPQYMSPEQASLLPQIVDIRTDVYSMGVVLYELLTGELPYERMQRGSQSAAEVLSLVRDAPVVPLVQRGSRPSLQLARLPVDLNWIVLRTLARDPDDRYASIEHLADDIRHFLDGRPVAAGPPTMRYRLSRWLHRHRAAAAMLVGLLAMMIVATAVSIEFAISAAQAKQNALDALQVAEKAENLAQSRFELAQAEGVRAQNALQAELLQREETEFRSYVAHLAAADSAIGHFDTFEAVTNLSEAPEKYRSFEWWYLLGRVDQSIRSFGGVRNFVQHGHQERVTQVAFHPTQAWLLTGGFDGAVIVWDVESAIELFRYDARSPVLKLGLAPSGEQVVVALADARLVHLALDIPDRRFVELQTLLEHSNPDSLASSEKIAAVTQAERDPPNHHASNLIGKGAVQAVQWSDDEKTLWVVVSRHDQSVLLTYQFNGRNLLRSKRKLMQTVIAAAIHGNGLLAFSYGRHVEVHSQGLGEIVWEVEHDEPVFQLAFSPDASRVAVSTSDLVIRVYDGLTGNQLVSIDGHHGPIESVRFSPDGNWFGSASQDGTLRIWSTVDYRSVATKWGHVREITDLAFSPDSELIATAGRLCAKTWTRHPNRTLPFETKPAREIHQVLATRESNLLLLHDASDRLCMYDLARGQEVEINTRKIGSNSKIRSTAISDDGRFVAWCCESGEPFVYSLEFQSLQDLSNHPNDVRAIAFDANNLYVADETGTIWRKDSDRSLFTLWSNLAKPIQRLAVSSNGSIVVCAQPDQLVILDGATGNVRDRKPMSSGWLEMGGNMAISDDGQTVFVTNYQSPGYQGYDYLSVWSSTSGWQYRLPAEHTHNIRSITCSRDGQRFVTASEDGTVKLWDLKRMQVVLTLRGPSGVCHSLTFSKSDRYLIGCDQHGRLISWTKLVQKRSNR